MKNSLTPAGIEPAPYRFVARHLNHCATAFSKCWGIFSQGQGSRGVTLATCPPTRSSEFENWRRYILTLRHVWFNAQEQIYFLLKTLLFNTANNHYGLVKNTSSSWCSWRVRRVSCSLKNTWKLNYYRYWYCTISDRKETVLRKPHTSLANRVSRSVEKHWCGWLKERKDKYNRNSL